MTKTEELAFRVRVDLDVLDMAKNEITRMRKFLKQERVPLAPDRRMALMKALTELQGTAP